MSANQPAGQSPHSAQVVIEELIREWQLQPHPEGGWYRELHRSHTMVKRGDGSERTAITTILYLLDVDLETLHLSFRAAIKALSGVERSLT